MRKRAGAQVFVDWYCPVCEAIGEGHGVDAHIPSDTEAFDNVVEMKKREDEEVRGMKELQAQLQITTLRCVNYAHFVINNEENGLGRDSLLRQIYTQDAFNHATIAALSKLIAQKLGISNKEILSETLKIVEENLFTLQQQYNIIIRPEGVTLGRNEDETHSESGGEDAG
jgi:hypothetical protein